MTHRIEDHYTPADDLSPETFWFSSDHHHGHERAIFQNSRPFKDSDHQDAQLVDDWNAKVPKQGIGYILGDFSFHKPDRTSAILGAMNGQITLIKGNHDSSKALTKVRGFNRVLTYLELRIDGDKVVLSHFPFLSWNQMHRGAYHLHGHSHGNLVTPPSLAKARMLDVGVDNLYRLTGHHGPLNFAEIRELLKFRKSASVDHHEIK